MLTKLIRTAIGLPFVLFMLIPYCVIILFFGGIELVLEGKLKDTKDMYKYCPFKPYQFLKKVWNN